MLMWISPLNIDFKHEIIALKDRGDKIHVDENVSDHGMFSFM